LAGLAEQCIADWQRGGGQSRRHSPFGYALSE
jgi:hypothetical protein